jgi:hypothetical protein
MSKQTIAFDGGLIVIESWTLNLFVYKSIGTTVSVVSNSTYRPWWCLWVCEQRRSITASRITISNHYSCPGEPGEPPFEFCKSDERTWTNVDSARLMEWEISLGAKSMLPCGWARQGAKAPRVART